MSPPIRILTAVPICDGHDSAINTINLELIRHGIEVVYLGFHRSAGDIARAAIQEDVRAIGISSYNGGHVEFFAEVIKHLRQHGATDIGVFGGGGGTISEADAKIMLRNGVDHIFFAGTPLQEMVKVIQKTYGRKKNLERQIQPVENNRRLGKLLTQAEEGRPGAAVKRGKVSAEQKTRTCKVIGVTGPGGAGKTTMIDELVLRFLKSDPDLRIAILSHDPSIVGDGALLGDRATMINSQDDRVFMRSMATRGQAGGLSPATERCLQILTHAGFGIVLVETVGTGQEAMPFHKSLVDQTLLVMNPDYGSRLQLQKIVMLDVADIVIVNKSDLARAKAASLEIERRLAQNKRGQKLLSTVAKQHGDRGVDGLFNLIKP
jgi:methylmalonyl-CoA mutase cobalamin-binding domain/chain